MAPSAISDQTSTTQKSAEHQWRTGSQVQNCQLDEHGLKEAVRSVHTTWEILDAITICLYLPSSSNHATVPVTMMRSSCSQSYIRAKTLVQNCIEREGNTVVLRWKNMAIRGDEDQMVQQTCFNVVDEELASQAGLRVDILVGCDHGLPLQDQIRYFAAEEIFSAGSSIGGWMDDLAAQSPERSHNDTRRRSSPASPRGSQPQIVMLMFNGPDADLNCARVYSSLRQRSSIGPPEAVHLDGRLAESQGPGSAKRKSRDTTSPGSHSRSREDQVTSNGRKGWRRWRIR